MKGLKIEVDFEDVVSDLFETAECGEWEYRPTLTFSDALRNSIVFQVKRELMSMLEEGAKELMREQAQQQITEFIGGELKGIIHRKMRSGEFRSRRVGFSSFDAVIEDNLSALYVSDVIKRHIDVKAAEFAKEMKARYDNIFAAKIVGALKEQKLLAPDVAKILLGDDE